MSFENFNLDPNIMQGVRAQGYTEPTPIQIQAIPPIMQGRDIIGLAQTGTGKTAAFLLPVMDRLLKLPRGRIGAAVISPTRELAEQTCEAIDALGQYTGLKSISIYGGVGMEQQIRRLRSGVDIIVACPGRLLDHIWKSTIDLSFVEMLVIDEADRMFDMGFLPDIRSILRCLVRPRQTMLFSATMPPDIRRLVQEALRIPVTVQIGHAAPADTVSHSIYPVKQHLKIKLLSAVLRSFETDSVLVFTRTKHRADRVALQLKRSGFRATALHGDLAQNRRQAALDDFRDGTVKILVATDIAARGIDVLSISHVINVDMPESVDAYTHRIGRTGRIDQKGDALTFVTAADADLVKEIEKVLKTPLERRKLQGFDYDAPVPAVSEEGSQRRSGFGGRRTQPQRAAGTRRR
ncbi:MAG: DEAD/DEAH box helicase [Dehalococcoidia bacterium]|nr:DEAD/DEAH box helicase [Dehalococcoidia bacterium]